MNSLAVIRPFEPFLINADKQQSLASLSLTKVLQWVTQYKIILLRGFQPMEREALLKYCQSHAKLLSWEFGPVMEMKVDKAPKNYLFTEGDVPLHWDGAFYHEPRFLFFNCIEAPLPGSGGETLFVNTEKVWADADPYQKARWQEYSLTFQTDKLAHYGGSIQRNLVNLHPDTKQTILRFAEPVGEDYLNPVHVRVVGKTDFESENILLTLSRCMRSAPYLYQHQWKEGDFLIADNFSLLHGRNAFKQHSPRHLRRIQIL